jgi:hypothetical protein
MMVSPYDGIKNWAFEGRVEVLPCVGLRAVVCGRVCQAGFPRLGMVYYLLMHRLHLFKSTPAAHVSIMLVLRVAGICR